MTSYIYIIEAEELERIKIGVADNPDARLSALRALSPCTIRIAALITVGNREDAFLLESELHKRYVSRRIHGEWFDVSADEAINDLQWSVRIASINFSIERREQTHSVPLSLRIPDAFEAALTAYSNGLSKKDVIDQNIARKSTAYAAWKQFSDEREK